MTVLIMALFDKEFVVYIRRYGRECKEYGA